MDVLSVTGSYSFASFEQSRRGALTAAWAVLFRSIYTRTAECASSKRSLRDLTQTVGFFIRPPRKAIRVRRWCNECTNQPRPPLLSLSTPWNATAPWCNVLFVDLPSSLHLFAVSDSPVRRFTHARETFFVSLPTAYDTNEREKESPLRPIYISISRLARFAPINLLAIPARHFPV